MTTVSEDKAWLEYKERIAQVYDKLNYQSSLQNWVMRAGHRLAERPFAEDMHFENVLEVGAGTGEHIPFVRHSFNRYVVTDADSVALSIAEKKVSAQQAEKFIFETQTGERLPYPDQSFDRLIAAHLLEHIPHPHLALKEWQRVLKPGGVLTLLLPTDPGMLWRFGRHLGPRRRALELGIQYDYVQAREHINSCFNLRALLRHYHPRLQEAWWPLPVPVIDLNLFYVCHARVHE